MTNLPLQEDSSNGITNELCTSSWLHLDAAFIAGAKGVRSYLHGKFQGVIAATTPTGCFTVTILTFGFVVANVSPYTLLPSSANQSIDAALQGRKQNHQSS